MSVELKNDLASFLSGGGEMGALTRAKDWSTTPVGDPDSWPQSLRTTLSILLNSRFPMFLWWGPELIQFYNDAYRPSLGQDGKHPSALGQKAEDCWQEIWPIIKPLIDQVLAGEGSTWSEDQLIPIYRNGSLEDVYWTFSYSPVKDESGHINGVLVVCNETTKNILTLKTLEESEERLKIVIDASELGTWELNVKTNQLTYSQRYREVLGYKEDMQMAHADFMKNLHPEDMDVRAAAFKKAFETGALHYETRLIWNDSSIHWVEARGKVFYDEDHQPLKLIGTIRDITEEKLRQQRIEESESRLRIAALSSELGTWDYTPATQVLRWDNVTRELFGVDADTPVTLDLFWNKMHPEDREPALQRMLAALDPNIPDTYDAEYRIFFSADEMRWIHGKGKALFNAQNEPYLFSGTVLDITEKKLALQELSESEEKFRLLADSMPQFVWTGNEQGILNYFNRSVYVYTGLTPEQIDTDGWLQIVHPDDRDENMRLWIRSVQTGEDFLYEHRFRRHDGVYRWQLSRAIAQRDANGVIQMWVGTSTDIHEQKTFSQELEQEVQQRTRELEQSNEELLKSNNELAEFAYVASHDLQEPLRKIQTFSTRLLDSEKNLSEKGRDYFARMQSASQRMQQLIIDLLSYSRANAIEKHAEPADLNTVLHAAKEQLKETIEQKQAVITSSGLPVLTIVPFQFEQLFTNIISNALKFSKAGISPLINITGAVVSGKDTDHKSADPAKQYQRITITDNGIGFDPQYKDRIFQVFQRLHGRDEYAGTGIGLSIVKKIAENHGGFMDVESEPGKGAVFMIYVPVSQ